MDRGLVIKLKHYPIADQRAALKAADVDVIYTNTEEAIRSLRKGDKLAIATPLHILGHTRDKIDMVVERIMKKGCAIWEVTRGMITTGAGVGMMAQALRAISNENRFGDLKKASAKGHENRWSTARARRKKTYDQAYKIWWSLDLPATVALSQCKELGWSSAAVYGDKDKDIRGLMNEQWEHPPRKTGRPKAPWK